MSKNLYKSDWVVYKDDGKKLIDSNETMAKKMEFLHQKMQEQEREREEQRRRSRMQEEGDEEFIPGLSAESVEALLTDEDIGPAYTGPTPEELVEAAQAEIAEMMATAQAEAEEMKKNAYAQGKDSGYRDGQSEAMRQAEIMKKEFAAKEKKLEAEYEEKFNHLSTSLVEELTGIYEHIFHVEFSNKKDVIVHLLTEALHQIEGSRDFIIHVSKEDYPYVSMQKKEIMNGMGANVSVEVIEDSTLSMSECMIETMGGIFDCGLDTQLSELSKELRLLSYGKG